MRVLDIFCILMNMLQIDIYKQNVTKLGFCSEVNIGVII